MSRPTPDRDELLLENARACIARAALPLRAALDGWRRGGLAEEHCERLANVIEQVEFMVEEDG